MDFSTKWYVHTDEVGFEKLIRFLRKDGARPGYVALANRGTLRLLEVTFSQKNHIRTQQKYLRITYTIYYNDGHGVRPWRV
jgi:hypothetical protein